MKRRRFISLGLLCLFISNRAASNSKSNNITSYINNEVSAGRSVHLSDGVYTIDSDVIKLQSGIRLTFSLNAIIYINVHPRSKFVFLIDSESDITIIGGQFQANDDAVEVISIRGNSKNINIKNVYCSGCRLLQTNAGVAYDDVLTDRLIKDISVISCRGTGRKIITKRAFIEFRYIKESKCIGCYISSYYHGVMFWGGDAEFNRDGRESNERKVKHIQIKANTITNVQQGGLWGAMGESIEIESNHLNDGGDVGIDFEGCIRCTASNNVVRNFKNGGLATFFLCDSISFINNVSISTVHNNKVAAIFNATQLQSNKNLSFVGNKFLGDGVVAAFIQKGAIENLLIKKNEFINTTIDLTSNNNGTINIVDNVFYFSILPISPMQMIKVGNIVNSDSRLVFVGNVINTEKKWFENKFAFYLNIEKNPKIIIIISNNSIDKYKVINPIVIQVRKNEVSKFTGTFQGNTFGSIKYIYKD